MSMGLTLAKYRLTLRAQDTIALPPFAGAAFRGGLGYALLRVGCVTRGQCDPCLLGGRCVYGYIFETPVPADSAVLSKNSHAPHPFVIEPPINGTAVYAQGDRFKCHLVLVGRAIEYFPYFIVAFEDLGRRGIGPGRGRFRLEEVVGVAPGLEVPVYVGGTHQFVGSGVTLTATDVCLDGSETESVEVEFLTPARLKYADHLTAQVEFHVLVRALLRRMSSLQYFHCGEALELDFKAFIDEAQAVRVESRKLRWVDWQRYSTRKEERMSLGGVVGSVSYRGALGRFMPLLRLGEYVHVGKQTSFGLGQMRVIV
jgi:hypothetical protein